MSKYTQEQLRAMVSVVALHRRDPRTEVLIARLSAATGFGTKQTIYKIYELAK